MPAGVAGGATPTGETDDEAFTRAVASRLERRGPAPHLEPRLERAAHALATEVAAGRTTPPILDLLADHDYRAAAASAAVVRGEPDPGAASRSALGRLEPVEGGALELGTAVVSAPGGPVWVVLLAVSVEARGQRVLSELPDLDVLRTEVGEAVDRRRREHGLPPLAADPCLEAVAQSYAETSLAAGRMQHVAPDGSTPGDRVRAAGCGFLAVGENLATGPTGAEAAVDGWMASPGHRRNLLDPEFSALGVGVARGQDTQGEARILWVQLLAGR